MALRFSAAITTNAAARTAQKKVRLLLPPRGAANGGVAPPTGIGCMGKSSMAGVIISLAV